MAQNHAPLTPKNSRLNFALDKIQTRLNNTFGSNFYQVYNGTVNAQPGLGNASELRISDVMDDKHIVGGYTIPANLSNTFFGLAYLDLERQVDRILSLERQTTARVDPQSGQLVETATHLLRREWRWAFDEVRSLRWGAAFRFNHDVVQGTDLFSATTPNGTGEQLGLQVAYVHDDTRSPRLNIRHGLRARVWAEMFVDGVATASAAGGELTGPEQGWTFGTVGFDARRYVPLVGPSILALRLAGDWSIGQRKLLHMLGGTDNSLSLQGNANTPVDPDVPFAYQARIAPLRGFQSNVRNGANVALANAEVRVPVFFSGAGVRTSSSICKPWPLQTSVPPGRAFIPTRTRTPSILSLCSPTRSPSRSATTASRCCTTWALGFGPGCSDIGSRPTGPTGWTTESPCHDASLCP